VTAPPAPRFLIDENLSPRLVEPARARGYEAMHVNHLGLRTEVDWDLLRVVAAQDWVLVTNNAIEFRGRYREIELHPGVVFLLPAVRREMQLIRTPGDRHA
jgi:predicted nuclease of predicted toxin-antitoxin system